MSYIRGASADERDFPTLLDIKAAFGFIPNFFLAQTLRPDLIDAEVGLVGTILLKEGALTRQQKEYIFLACSADNLSTYCVTAHCEIVRLLGIEGPEPEQVALDHTVANIPEREKALLDFAVRLNNRPTEVGQPDIDALRTHGFADQHVLETVVMVGLAKFANFIAFGLGTIPDFDPSPVERILNLSPKQPVLISQRTGVSASTPDEDADFVRRTLAGELDAFDVLIRRHQQRIYRTLMAITRNKEDAEDGVQNVFLKAFQHLAGFQGASKFATWLTRIALNEGSERLRARKDFDSLDLEGPDNEPPFQPRDIMAWQANPEELYSKNELRHQVELGLLKLPVKYRIVVMLRDLQQLTAEETTEILQIGIPAMKSRLLRGRLMLRDALAPTLGRSAANV